MKTYIQPTICIMLLNAKEQLLDNSIKLGGDSVSNSQDIGFVKENRPSNYDAWSDDWSNN